MEFKPRTKLRAYTKNNEKLGTAVVLSDFKLLSVPGRRIFDSLGDWIRSICGEEPFDSITVKSVPKSTASFPFTPSKQTRARFAQVQSWTSFQRLILQYYNYYGFPDSLSCDTIPRKKRATSEFYIEILDSAMCKRLKPVYFNRKTGAIRIHSPYRSTPLQTEAPAGFIGVFYRELANEIVQLPPFTPSQPAPGQPVVGLYYSRKQYVDWNLLLKEKKNLEALGYFVLLRSNSPFLQDIGGDREYSLLCPRIVHEFIFNGSRLYSFYATRGSDYLLSADVYLKTPFESNPTLRSEIKDKDFCDLICSDPLSINLANQNKEYLLKLRLRALADASIWSTCNTAK